MAIDTAEKRRSAGAIGYLPIPQVTPNASPDAEWRLEVGGVYSAIIISAPAVSALTPEESANLLLVKRILANRSLITVNVDLTNTVEIFAEDDTTKVAEWLISSDGLERTRIL
jgi:hypothetical protein